MTLRFPPVDPLDHRVDEAHDAWWVEPDDYDDEQGEDDEAPLGREAELLGQALSQQGADDWPPEGAEAAQHDRDDDECHLREVRLAWTE